MRLIHIVVQKSTSNLSYYLGPGLERVSSYGLGNKSTTSKNEKLPGILKKRLVTLETMVPKVKLSDLSLRVTGFGKKGSVILETRV